MRKNFQQQLEFGITPIHEVKLDLKSRHSLVPILRGLQYVFETASINKEVFEILDKKIIGNKKRTGRPGMDLWEILVLGTVKLNLNIDYDALHDLTNEHNALRGILGIQRSDFREGQKYSLQSLKDNIRLLDEETIYEIVGLIVKGGHELVKKKEGKACLDLKIRTDSFVVESNIHFPTDLNLLWDSVRKCIETIGYFRRQNLSLTSWRE
jgi:IS5 family transposase